MSSFKRTTRPRVRCLAILLTAALILGVVPTSVFASGDMALTPNGTSLCAGYVGWAAASGGSMHSLGIKSDGTLWAWGQNSAGQLGDGSATNRLSPVQILDDAVFAATGDNHSMAVPSDGSLWVWGNNLYGKLGDGTSGDSLVPIQVMPAGSILPYATGVTVTGTVRSYNPSTPVTILLLRDAAEQYRTVIEEATGFGQATQSFAFTGVEPGDYTLVVTKPGHTSYTVQTVTVGEADADLNLDSRSAVQCMTLLCGDINGDGYINDSDLAILWQAANYNKAADQATNKLCDLNGDGYINDSDLAILWQAANYNKGEVVIP